MAVIVVVLAADTPSFAQGQLSQPPPIRAGFWETRLSALMLSGRDQRCVQDNEIGRFVGGPHNSVYACQYPTSIVANGRIAWHGTCVSRGDHRLRLDADGTYTDTAMNLRGVVHLRLVGVPIAAPFTVRARRLGDCTAFPRARR